MLSSDQEIRRGAEQPAEHAHGAAPPERSTRSGARACGEKRAFSQVSQQTGVRNVVLFFAAAFCLFIAAFGGSWIFFIFSLALFVAFVVSFLRLGKINLEVRRYREYVKINTEGLSRLVVTGPPCRSGSPKRTRPPSRMPPIWTCWGAPRFNTC